MLAGDEQDDAGEHCRVDGEVRGWIRHGSLWEEQFEQPDGHGHAQQDGHERSTITGPRRDGPGGDRQREEGAGKRARQRRRDRARDGDQPSTSRDGQERAQRQRLPEQERQLGDRDLAQRAEREEDGADACPRAEPGPDEPLERPRRDDRTGDRGPLQAERGRHR